MAGDGDAIGEGGGKRGPGERKHGDGRVGRGTRRRGSQGSVGGHAYARWRLRGEFEPVELMFLIVTPPADMGLPDTDISSLRIRP